eukprot:TRINITY_DN16591_c0_g3_i2.p1 TRINITY_DN16591_c0_g3~~TRINITY_DN16591_c0_g3_i2.p1  ORF type:complete len:902 (+),score=69.90 TRINITY_DN16591_c0_g3_i2:262-2706(+)
MGPGNHVSSSSTSAIRALAGCRITNDKVEECFNNTLNDAPHRRYHLAFETWTSGFYWMQWEEAGSNRHPALLGHLGYFGSLGPYIKKPSESKSIRHSGLSLRFYANYNITCFNRSRSFARLDDIEPSSLHTCSEVQPAVDAYLPEYIEHFSYDAGFGFEQNDAGSYSLKCHAGFWWLSPTCRANPGNCIPFLSNTYGHGMSQMMMKSSYWDLPIAIGFSRSAGQLPDVLAKHDIMLYRWQPDTLTVSGDLTPVMFPDYNETLAEQGLYITRTEDRLLNKWVMRGFEEHAVRAVEVARRMTFTVADINAMLSNVVAGQSHYQAACNWLQSGASPWRTDWVPSCPEGQFARHDSTAASGSSKAHTHVACVPCQPGRFRNDVRENSCNACPAGRFSGEGSAACEECRRGSYTSSPGSTTCEACSWWYTTASTGAPRRQDCILDPHKLAAMLAAALLGLPVLMGLFVRHHYKSMRQMEAAQASLKKGLEAIEELQHPMCLVKLSDFWDMSLEDVQTCHEGARTDGKVVFLDTLRTVENFRTKGGKTLFFSYAWKSWYKLGPDFVQLECMKEAARRLCQLREEEVTGMYVWLDVLAIPPLNPKSKSLAVDSLFSYASMTDYFVAICPEGIHEDSGEPAGQQAYASRVWCRVEQVAHASVNGFGCMYHSQGPDHLEPIDQSWIQQIIYIFEAEMTCCRRGHPNNMACDRELLVPTLLAMYAVLLVRLKPSGDFKKALSGSVELVWRVLNEDMKRAFPPTHSYRRSDATKQQRILFGNGMTCFRKLAASPGGIPQVKKMLSSSPLGSRGRKTISESVALLE